MRIWPKRRPSPALAISIAALVVALTGSAIAGVATISKLSKSEKQKVRGLADQEIDKKASGLSVKSATSATTAGSAASAGVAGDVSNQLWAVVNENGTLTRATAGITGVTPNPPGKYFVHTNRNVTGCYYVASLGGDEPDAGARGDISVNPSTGSPNDLYVLTSNTAAANENRSFTLLIRC
jgi:hypothetical protein